jgi:hypothetical protein
MQDVLINVIYDSASKKIIFTKKDGSSIIIQLEFDTTEIEEELEEISTKVNSCIKTVSYDANTGILTFTKINGSTETIDLPLELLINSGRYDNANKQIILTLANLDTITIPIGDILTEIYTKEEIDDFNKYSLDEKIVGTWVDGKPLYRKVINFGNLPNMTYKRVEHGISNLDIIKSVDCVANNSDSSTFLPIPYVTVSEGNVDFPRQISLQITNTDITINSPMVDRSEHSAYITIEYTKTTD